MTAFLKIDTCRNCHRAIPWEWAPAIVLNGKPMAGTGVWRSQLMDACCPACHGAFEKQRALEQQALALHKELVELLGGDKPCRQFIFERYQVTPGNRVAYDRCKEFCPATENLYLWGPCGVGKTHLAYATARRCFEETLSATVQPAGQLTRKVRMRDPAQEQTAIEHFASVDVLILDDLGIGTDTAYGRQLLQEILDRRDFADRAGLVVTSRYSLEALAQRLQDDSIPSRLAGMCTIVQIQGADARLRPKPAPYNLKEGSS
jgi:DNA replication protein DnaC